MSFLHIAVIVSLAQTVASVQPQTPIPTPTRDTPSAEKAAAELLEERMRTQNPEDLAILRAVNDRQIVVVRGSMDHIERVLRAAEIKHTLVNPRDVPELDLTNDHIVMINCPGRLTRKGVKRIEKFVRAGGMLYTTDWALKNVVQRAFPGTIKHNGRSTGDHVTPVHVHEAENNIMSNMLLADDSKPQWWLEGGSYPVRILNKDKVKVLASSKQMKRRYGSSPVVMRFGWEDGVVVHVVSHFYRQAKTRGRRVATKDALDKVGGLTAAQKAKLAKSGAGNVAMSEVESSYAFQQMTSNLVVKQRKRKKKLNSAYSLRNKQDVTVDGRPARKGSRFKLLKKKGAKVKVRDDRGNEAWLDASLF